MLGTIFGIATSLGIGVVQLNFGLNEIFGIEQGKAAQIGLIALSVVIATASATSGVDKGIRRLSEINVILAIAMLIYITVAKDADFLLNGLVQNAGDYVSTFADRTLDTFAWDQVNPPPGNDARAFVDGWTLFFWAWWVAWAPFVGLFLARISRGRTLRQFVFGVLVVPFSFILVWISIFGNSALAVARGDQEFAETTASTPEAGFYSLLEQYPGATLLIGIATITGLLFYVTSADSGSLVMGNFTSRLADPMADCQRSLRIFWSVAIGLLTLSMLFAGGGDGSILTLQAATVIMGLPFSFVLGLIGGVSLLRAVRNESYKLDSFRHTLPKVIAVGRGPTEQASWRQRLVGTLRFPRSCRDPQVHHRDGSPGDARGRRAVRPGRHLGDGRRVGRQRGSAVTAPHRPTGRRPGLRVLRVAGLRADAHLRGPLAALRRPVLPVRGVPDRGLAGIFAVGGVQPRTDHRRHPRPVRTASGLPPSA